MSSFKSIVSKAFTIMNALQGSTLSNSGRDGLKVYQGDRTYGTPAYTIKGNKVYQGDRTYGTPAFTLAF